jgi:hypothetical protein
MIEREFNPANEGRADRHAIGHRAETPPFILLRISSAWQQDMLATSAENTIFLYE